MNGSTAARSSPASRFSRPLGIPALQNAISAASRTPSVQGCGFFLLFFALCAGRCTTRQESSARAFPPCFFRVPWPYRGPAGPVMHKTAGKISHWQAASGLRCSIFSSASSSPRGLPKTSSSLFVQMYLVTNKAAKKAAGNFPAAGCYWRWSGNRFYKAQIPAPPGPLLFPQAEQRRKRGTSISPGSKGFGHSRYLSR